MAQKDMDAALTIAHPCFADLLDQLRNSRLISAPRFVVKRRVVELHGPTSRSGRYCLIAADPPNKFAHGTRPQIIRLITSVRQFSRTSGVSQAVAHACQSASPPQTIHSLTFYGLAIKMRETFEVVIPPGFLSKDGPPTRSLSERGQSHQRSLTYRQIRHWRSQQSGERRQCGDQIHGSTSS